MTALKWDDIDLGSATLRVVDGKGGKTARVNLSSTLAETLEHIPLEQRTGYLLPACPLAGCRLQAARGGVPDC